MNESAMERYLHEHIPQSRAMGVSVRSATVSCVTLSAPFAPNINHRDTVFGGSASAVAMLAAWTLVYEAIEREGLSCQLVIQRNTMEFLRPITGEFTASSVVEDPSDWSAFLHTLKRKGKARVTVPAVLHCHGERVGTFEGVFVALETANQSGSGSGDASHTTP